MTGKTIFYSKEGFSIEFLTIPDRTMSITMKVPGLSIVAEALPKMAPAGWNYIQLEWQGMNLKIVSPVSYILQKLLINKDRASDYKKQKDLEAVKYVLSYIKQSKKYNDKLVQSFDEYPKKWKKTILNTAIENDIVLF